MCAHKIEGISVALGVARRHKCSMKMPPDMVIFDCDGVLVDSEKLTGDVLRASLAEHGLPLTSDAFNAFALGGTIQGVYEQALQLGADLPGSWVEDIYEDMFAVLEAQVELIEGIEPVLDRLDSAGILYAVGSNGPHRKMQITLRRTGLFDRFKGRIWSREDVPSPKPAPDVYLKAASQAGVSPARCVVVEDSVSGARAAKAAGIYCLGYAADTDAAILEPVCDVVFDNMSELSHLLDLRNDD